MTTARVSLFNSTDRHRSKTSLFCSSQSEKLDFNSDGSRESDSRAPARPSTFTHQPTTSAEVLRCTLGNEASRPTHGSEQRGSRRAARKNVLRPSRCVNVQPRDLACEWSCFIQNDCYKRVLVQTTPFVRPPSRSTTSRGGGSGLQAAKHFEMCKQPAKRPFPSKKSKLDLRLHFLHFSFRTHPTTLAART